MAQSPLPCLLPRKLTVWYELALPWEVRTFPYQQDPGGLNLQTTPPKINKYLDEGCASLITDQIKASISDQYFLPRHGVMKKTNAAKPGEKKLRVVFDAAAPFNGKNLNDVLLAGPASRENQDPKTTSSSRSGKEKPPSWASSGGLHSTSSTSPFASLWTSSSRGTGSSASSRRFLDPLGLASLVTVQAKIKLKTLSL